MTDQHTPSFDWMNADVERVRAVPGEHGLTLKAINIGRYGEVPDRWPFTDDTLMFMNSTGWSLGL